MKPQESRPERVLLLVLAAESILDAMPGCAERIRARSLLPRIAAIDHFGPRIVARWAAWLATLDEEKQKCAIMNLADLGPRTSVQTVKNWLDEHPQVGSEEDRQVCREYLTAIPATCRAVFESLSASPLSLATVTDPHRLARLLPINAPPFPIGSDVPGTPYRLQEMLGSGGFGVVYKAMNRFEQHTEPRALKFCLNPELLPSLKRERDLLDRLMNGGKESKWSDRVVKLLGHNLDAEVPFLVYEFVQGGNLVTRLSALRQRTEKELQPGQVLGLIRRVCEAVSFAHELGLVHRDVKPSNILVSGNTLKLGDFGIGGVVADYAARTQPKDGASSYSEQGSVFRGAGTPLYMSPEQRRGDPADPRHDVYSIGVMWFQLLVNDHTRELPQGWEDELADEHDVPARHIDLIQACVGYVKKRPANAMELLKALPGAGATAATVARSTKPGEGRILGSHDTAVSCVGYGGDPRRIFSASNDGVVRVWTAEVGGGLLAECRPKTRSLLTLAVSSDSRRALFGGDGKVAWLWDVVNNREALSLAGHTGKVMSAAFSPDVRRAATGGSDATIRLWHVGTGRELLRITEHTKAISALQFTSDGERLVACDEGGVVGVWDTETGWATGQSFQVHDWLLCLAISPDDRSLAVGGKSSLTVWDLATKKRVHDLVGHDLAVMGVAFTPDGNLLASAGLDNKIRLWETTGGKLSHTFAGHSGGILSLAASPDGRELATGGFDKTVRLWGISAPS